MSVCVMLAGESRYQGKAEECSLGHTLHTSVGREDVECLALCTAFGNSWCGDGVW